MCWDMHVSKWWDGLYKCSWMFCHVQHGSPRETILYESYSKKSRRNLCSFSRNLCFGDPIILSSPLSPTAVRKKRAQSSSPWQHTQPDHSRRSSAGAESHFHTWSSSTYCFIPWTSAPPKILPTIVKVRPGSTLVLPRLWLSEIWARGHERWPS